MNTNRFLDRLLSSTCSIGPEAAGGAPPADAGGGSTPAPASSSEPTRIGGADHPDYDHKFPQPSAPTEEQVTKVRGILDGDQNSSLSMSDIGALLDFNPPFQPAEPVVPPAAQVNPPVDPKATPPAQGAQPPAGTPPATPADPTQAIVQALREVLPQVAQQPQPAAPAQPQAPKRYYGDHKPAMQVAPQLTQALFNAENPEQAHQALNVLVGGMMNQIMQDVASDQAQLAKLILDRVPQMFQNHYQAANTFNSFYNDYPELNKPAFAETIKGLATALAEQRQRAGQPLWDQTFRQTLGEAVHAYLKQQFGFDIPRAGTTAPPVVAAQPPAAAASPAAQPPVKPNGLNGQPWMSPGGSRPPAGPGSTDKSAALFDLIM